VGDAHPTFCCGLVVSKRVESRKYKELSFSQLFSYIQTDFIDFAKSVANCSTEEIILS
jgi:hypothetical protein